jgi:hypothetical protein
MAMMNKFIRFDPKRSPRVKSGFPNMATELMPVASSGSEVIVARSTTPIQMRPSPVFSAMMSPYLDSFVPATSKIARQITNFIQTSAVSYACLLHQNNIIFRCAGVEAMAQDDNGAVNSISASCFWWIAACAATSLAIGTLNGLQLT